MNHRGRIVAAPLKGAAAVGRRRVDQRHQGMGLAQDTWKSWLTARGHGYDLRGTLHGQGGGEDGCGFTISPVIASPNPRHQPQGVLSERGAGISATAGLLRAGAHLLGCYVTHTPWPGRSSPLARAHA
jgi:hypothetical protein